MAEEKDIALLADNDIIVEIEVQETPTVVIDTTSTTTAEISGDSALGIVVGALPILAKEETLTKGISEIKESVANIDLSSVESKVEEVGNKIDNIKLPEVDTTELAKQGENQEATNSKILEEIGNVKETTENINIPLSAISGLALELEGGKKNIVNALKTRGVEASVESDTLTDLAAKVHSIKNPIAFTVPASTTNAFANDIFNTMMKSQGYDQMYEQVRETYCGEGGEYIGCLMTSLLRSTNTTIQLIGADAYYIYEENTFYKTGEDGNLIQFLDGVEVQLTTKNHLWDTTNLDAIRTVFYLYVQDSTADGNRENVHSSYFDYCNNSIIPCYQYKTNSGKFIHLHVANPDTCVIMWNGGSNNGNATRYIYSNVYNITKNLIPYNITTTMMFFNLPELRNVNLPTGTQLLVSSNIKDVDFSKLETVVASNKVMVSLTSYNKDKISFPSLRECSGNIFTTRSKDSFEVDFPSAEIIKNGPIPFSVKNLTIKIKNGCSIECVTTKTTNVYNENIHVVCEELYTNGHGNQYGGDYPDFKAINSITFDGLRKCDIFMGATASYTNGTKSLYINCIGDRDDLIRFYFTNTATQSSTDVEISEGTRQPLAFIYFNKLTPDNIVNHIFNKLADNRFEDDGITPAPAITITLGANKLKELTDEQKAIATDKNYILA